MSAIIKLTHSLPRIVSDCVENTAREEKEFEFEIVDDHYLLYLSQRRSKMAVTSGGKPMHHGEVVPGMMRLAAPGEQVRTIHFSPVKAMVIKIPGPLLREILRRTEGAHPAGKVCFIDPLLQPDTQVEQLGRLLLHHKEFDPANESFFVQGITQALLACLLRGNGRPLRSAHPVKGLTTKEIQSSMSFADASMEGRLTLDDWAAELRMPTSEFRRRFRLATGCTPYAWYMERRIERAKQMLLSRNATLCDIALSVGFYSQSHFTDAFRRVSGTTPAQWQRQQSGKVPLGADQFQ